MTQMTWQVRLFGGRNTVVNYDSTAGTVSVLGQSVLLSSFSAALQAEWAEAAATTRGFGDGGSMVPAPAPFGGCNVQRALGNLLDAAPAWRTASQAALAQSAI